MQKIILVTGGTAQTRVDLVSRLYVESPSECRIIKTRADLERAILTHHTALVLTDPKVLDARIQAFGVQFPAIPMEVVEA